MQPEQPEHLGTFVWHPQSYVPQPVVQVLLLTQVPHSVGGESKQVASAVPIKSRSAAAGPHVCLHGILRVRTVCLHADTQRPTRRGPPDRTHPTTRSASRSPSTLARRPRSCATLSAPTLPRRAAPPPRAALSGSASHPARAAVRPPHPHAVPPKRLRRVRAIARAD